MKSRQTALADLRRAGLRIYSSPDYAPLPSWNEEPLPAWTAPYRWNPGQSLRGVRYLLTFCPFTRLPAAVRRALPGRQPALAAVSGQPVVLRGAAVPEVGEGTARGRADSALALALSPRGAVGDSHSAVGLAARGARRADPRRTPISAPYAAPFAARTAGPASTATRTNWPRSRPTRTSWRTSSSAPRADDVGLYGKPMARNAQLWTQEFQLLLDGPRAAAAELARAAERLAAGGLFGYRLFYPPMHVGRHEVFWHRPLVAYLAPRDRIGPTLLPDAPLGCLTAHAAGRPRSSRPVELWPRLPARPDHQEAIRLLLDRSEPHYHRACSTSASCWRPGRCWAGGRWRRVSPGSCSPCPRNSRWTIGFARCPSCGRPGGGRARAWSSALRRCVAVERMHSPAACRLRSPSPTRPSDASRRPIGRPSPCWPRDAT